MAALKYAVPADCLFQKRMVCNLQKELQSVFHVSSMRS